MVSLLKYLPHTYNSGASDAPTPTSLVMSTEQGDIVLTLRYDSAPHRSPQLTLRTWPARDSTE